MYQAVLAGQAAQQQSATFLVVQPLVVQWVQSQLAAQLQQVVQPLVALVDQWATSQVATVSR
jgi:hypothetical protein